MTPSERKDPWSKAEDDAIIVLTGSGPVPRARMQALAAKLGRSYVATCVRASKLGCPGVNPNPWLTVQKLARKTGYYESRIWIAIERLGITLTTHGRRKNGTPKVLSIDHGDVARIIQECQSVPDGGLLCASKHGEWGRRGKFRVNPKQCLHCGTNERPHYARGQCRKCYRNLRAAAKRERKKSLKATLVCSV